MRQVHSPTSGLQRGVCTSDRKQERTRCLARPLLSSSLCTHGAGTGRSTSASRPSARRDATVVQLCMQRRVARCARRRRPYWAPQLPRAASSANDILKCGRLRRSRRPARSAVTDVRASRQLSDEGAPCQCRETGAKSAQIPFGTTCVKDGPCRTERWRASVQPPSERRLFGCLVCIFSTPLRAREHEASVACSPSERSPTVAKAKAGKPSPAPTIDVSAQERANTLSAVRADARPRERCTHRLERRL